jgi:dolichol-phosphate mannosyltransferase
MKLNVIVPARNEQLNVPYFYERARRALDALRGIDWSIVFVNNGSEDGTLAEILALRAADPRVNVITLSRNFGYHAALVAGLSSVDGDYYGMIDVDCEDPPELLVDFYRALHSGTAQVAYGVRSNRDEPALVTFGRKLFYIANRRVADSEIVMWMGEFSMMTRQVRDAVLASKTTFISLRAEMGYVGFPRIGIHYQRAQRKYGETHYNVWRMTTFAVASILSGTTFPLRLVLYLAMFVAVAFPLAVGAFRLSAVATGVTASVATLYFCTVSLSLMSLYLARTYKNVVLRPTFVIDWSRTHLSEGSSARTGPDSAILQGAGRPRADV